MKMDETEMAIALLDDFGIRYYNEHPEKRQEILTHGGFCFKSMAIRNALQRLEQIEKRLDR
jgi:hypothetical protein